MSAVLADYHLAQAIATEQPVTDGKTPPDSLSLRQRRLAIAVFEKHHISPADFEVSMKWYTRHPEELQKIYAGLSEASSSAPKVTNAGDKASADTLMLWQAAADISLSPRQTRYNVTTIATDTLLREGDVLHWSFRTDWHYHEGARAATAVLVTRYAAPDTTTFTTLHLNTTGQQRLTHRLLRTPKQVKLLLYQHTPLTERMRLLSVSNAMLFCFRDKPSKSLDGNGQASAKPAADKNGATDSAGAAAQGATIGRDTVNHRNDRRIRDSILNQETIDRKRSHFK